MNDSNLVIFKNLNKLAFIALLIAVIPIWPYFFYQLLKFLVCGAAAYSAYTFYKQHMSKSMWIMIVVAIIFNPINPFYFGHFLWSVLDIVIAVVFFRATKSQGAKAIEA